MIATVEARPQTVRARGIAHHCVEVDHGIEMPRLADPAIDRLAIGLADRLGPIIG